MNDKTPNPIDVALAATEKLAAFKQQKDFQLWETWKANPTPETIRPLMQHFEPVLQNKMRMLKAPIVNEGAFDAQLKVLAVKAFQTYDPMRGAALRTHLDTYLRKSMRYNNQQQNFAYIPEGKSRVIGPIDSISNELTEDLGRSPSHGEIADMLNERLKPRRPFTGESVKKIQDSRIKDVISSTLERDPSPNVIDRDREVVSLLRPTLQPEHQIVFDHLYGINGKRQITSTNDLAKELNKTPSQISRIRTAILQHFNNYR